ncbi:type IX secretion system anionic LPS delivery protein PorZ [Reichenbachiella versicolor]|uniref:type IX secretion system anionic LPS delivery protein PorZ n=1 Tax=Reichenbachiella versicolor TaxID=1821036 RepID=UPI000D6DF986|nr:hypothetical protein [Reichenbachiella versicolor]
MKNKAAIILFFIPLSIYGQNIPIGTWRTHFNYTETLLVEETTNSIFAAASSGLTYYSSEDKSLNNISKIDGLSEVSVSALAFDEPNERLVIGYNNGNIDIIDDRGIVNSRVILESSVIEDKTIHHISFYESLINVSTNFGVLQIEPENDEVKEAFRNLGDIGQSLQVRKSVVIGTEIFLATPQGVISADFSSGKNLSDFNSWDRYESSIIDDVDILSIASFDDGIIACSATELFSYGFNSWKKIDTPDLHPEEEITLLRSGSNTVLILTSNRVFELKSNLELSVIKTPTEDRPQDILRDKNGQIWYADIRSGLTLLVNEEPSRFVLNGPGENISKLNQVIDQTIALPSIISNAPFNNNKGYSSFTNGVWKTNSPETISGLENISQVYNDGNREWIVSFGGGILDFTNTILYDEENSTLTSNVGNILTSYITSDSNGNIWVTEQNNNSPVHQLNQEGIWTKHNLSSTLSDVTSINNDFYDNLWMSLKGNGLIGYNPETGSELLVNSTNSELPSNQVNDIAFGTDGAIWVATDLGVAYFPFSFGIIENPTALILPIFDEGILFEEKKVNSIEVDSGNRKWMATTTGAWLFSPSVGELILKFDINNSPLPSNNVLDISINPISGEVFFLTDQGIVSYRSESVQGSQSHKNVKIFPNPVRPEFSDWVGIQGVANDAIIKITTVSGRLVREINAAGGGASWNISDYKDRRVNTGVYLVFSSNSDGSETYVGKIAVFN